MTPSVVTASIPLSLYRPYAGHKFPSFPEHEHLFKQLGYDTRLPVKQRYRIYVDLKRFSAITDQNMKPRQLLEDFITDFKVEDFRLLTGEISVYKYQPAMQLFGIKGRILSIGRLFTLILEWCKRRTAVRRLTGQSTDLRAETLTLPTPFARWTDKRLQQAYHEFLHDKRRQSSRLQQTGYLVISRHSYDILGMSFDRGWTSCMNLQDGVFKEMLKAQITEGTLVAYLLKAPPTGSNPDPIARPVARSLIKPVYSQKGIRAFIVDEPYGSPIPEFVKAVSQVVERYLNVDKPGDLYSMTESLHNDQTANRFPINLEPAQVIQRALDAYADKDEIVSLTTIPVDQLLMWAENELSTFDQIAIDWKPYWDHKLHDNDALKAEDIPTGYLPVDRKTVINIQELLALYLNSIPVFMHIVDIETVTGLETNDPSRLRRLKIIDRLVILALSVYRMIVLIRSHSGSQTDTWHPSSMSQSEAKEFAKLVLRRQSKMPIDDNVITGKELEIRYTNCRTLRITAAIDSYPLIPTFVSTMLAELWADGNYSDLADLIESQALTYNVDLLQSYFTSLVDLALSTDMKFFESLAFKHLLSRPALTNSLSEDQIIRLLRTGQQVAVSETKLPTVIEALESLPEFDAENRILRWAENSVASGQEQTIDVSSDEELMPKELKSAMQDLFVIQHKFYLSNLLAIDLLVPEYMNAKRPLAQIGVKSIPHLYQFLVELEQLGAYKTMNYTIDFLLKHAFIGKEREQFFAKRNTAIQLLVLILNRKFDHMQQHLLVDLPKFLNLYDNHTLHALRKLDIFARFPAIRLPALDPRLIPLITDLKTFTMQRWNARSAKLRQYLMIDNIGIQVTHMFTVESMIEFWNRSMQGKKHAHRLVNYLLKTYEPQNIRVLKKDQWITEYLGHTVYRPTKIEKVLSKIEQLTVVRPSEDRSPNSVEEMFEPYDNIFKGIDSLLEEARQSFEPNSFRTLLLNRLKRHPLIQHEDRNTGLNDILNFIPFNNLLPVHQFIKHLNVWIDSVPGLPVTDSVDFRGLPSKTSNLPSVYALPKNSLQLTVSRHLDLETAIAMAFGQFHDRPCFSYLRYQLAAFISSEIAEGSPPDVSNDWATLVDKNGRYLGVEGCPILYRSLTDKQIDIMLNVLWHKLNRGQWYLVDEGTDNIMAHMLVNSLLVMRNKNVVGPIYDKVMFHPRLEAVL